MPSTLKLFSLALLVAAGLALAGAPAHADTIDFANPGGMRADNAPSDTGDYERSTMTWETYCGLDVTAYSARPRADYALVVHDLNPDGGGLGVQAYDSDACRLTPIGDDEVDYRESLTFTFDELVTLDWANFNNKDHGQTFKSGAEVGVRVDGGTLQYFDLSNPVYLDLSGTSFTFVRVKTEWHWSGGQKVYDHIGQDFYIDSIGFTKTAAEPSSLGLLGLGLVAVAYSARRRKTLRRS